MLGGPAVAGVGWAAGIERLAMLAGDADSGGAERWRCCQRIQMTDLAAFRLAEKLLRDAGIDIDFPTAGFDW